MPLQATSGAASYDGFGGGVAAVPQYIEDVFSTYLYTGNGSTQTITNGIDLAGKGGLVWTKKRSAIDNHMLADTARGASNILQADRTDAQFNGGSAFIPSFTSSGYTTGTYPSENGATYASWTFRKQPKFYTQGTFTGDGTTNKVITHDLNGTTGCIIVKRTDGTGNWQTWHRTFTTKQTIFLNTTDAAQTYPSADAITVTDNSFTVGTNQIFGNGNGWTYVYYVFAHNAGGFGLTGTDNVISCGSFSLDSAVGVDVNLGYEAQWVMIKRTDSSAGSSGWYLLDTMRGWTVDATFGDMYLVANTTAAEAGQSIGRPTATGFAIQASTWLSTGDYIYIAIRRGPMKVPTSGTSVFSPALYTGTGSTNTITSPFPSDLLLVPNRAGQFYSPSFWDRLRGATKFLRSPGTDAEATSTDGLTSFGAGQNSVAVGADATYGNINFSGRNYVPYSFRRAPSFFDEVCYTGNNNLGRELNHNLGVTPELIIVKCRNATTDGDASFPAGWWTAVKGSGANGYWFIPSSGGGLNSNNASAYSDTWSSYFSGTTTFNPFYVTLSSGTGISGNVTGQTYVAYLFATCAGVSKVGSYTGNGSSQTINCGFTGGARFVLIKRTSTGGGDWYVWDTARGIVSGNDPHLSLNTTAAEVTTDDTIDPDSTGFIVNQLAATNVNVTSATYIFLAIA